MFANKFIITTVIAAFAIAIGREKTPVTTADRLQVHTKNPGKELYLPPKVYRIADNNDYSSNESDYSFKRMVEGDDIAMFWHKEFGDDPTSNPNEKKRFNPKEAIKEMERFYDYYVNNLKLVQKGNSLTDKYKMVLYVLSGEGGTAFGGGTDNKVGMLWTPPARLSKMPYGTLAHELGILFNISCVPTMAPVQGDLSLKCLHSTCCGRCILNG